MSIHICRALHRLRKSVQNKWEDFVRINNKASALPSPNELNQKILEWLPRANTKTIGIFETEYY